MGYRPSVTPRCTNCRRKRIKCDNQQPSCGQCIKSNLQCEAFKQKIVFIDSNSDSSVVPSSSTTPQPVQVQHLTPSAETLAHSPFLNSSIAKSGVYDQYFALWCPSSHAWWRRACTWLPVAFDKEQKHKPLLMATSAIGAAVMAAFNRDDSYRVYSMKMYGDSLLQLRNWTQNRPKDDWYKNLLTSLLLLSYEAFNPSQSPIEALSTHILGISSMLQQMGPEAFQEETDGRHCAFVTCRLALTVTSFVYESPSFLTSPPWTETPWVKHPKDEMNKMMDWLDMIPVLQQQSGRILGGIARSEGMMNEWTEFKNNRRHLIGSLDAWFDTQKEANPVLYSAITAVDGAETTHMYAHAGDLVTMLLLWTGRLLLHNCLFALQGCPDESVALEASLAMHREMGAADATVGHILRSVPWSAQRENGIMSKLFALPPLRHAARFCERWNMLDRLEQCRNMDRIITSGGCERLAG